MRCQWNCATSSFSKFLFQQPITYFWYWNMEIFLILEIQNVTSYLLYCYKIYVLLNKDFSILNLIKIRKRINQTEKILKVYIIFILSHYWFYLARLDWIIRVLIFRHWFINCSQWRVPWIPSLHEVNWEIILNDPISCNQVCKDVTLLISSFIMLD